MAAVVMDGKALAAKVKEEVRAQVERMERKPGLAVVLVGDDPASRVYVNGKKKDCGECGIYSEEYAIPAETTQQELLELVDTLNGREDIDGILVQLPLPRHLNEKEVLLAGLLPPLQCGAADDRGERLPALHPRRGDADAPGV